ncbi:MAG TPA: YceI family protein [Flavobacteriales bacterium]|nr:YceI family protein [Flavobacteriales bacterium]
MEKQTKWLVDTAHSDITFKIRHLMIANVKGSFKIFDASIYTSEEDFSTAEIDLWIDVSSITTGDAKRDEHLKSEEFFDVFNHKQITFVSAGIEPTPESNTWRLWGNLTIKGISKKIELDVEYGGLTKDPWGNQKAGFTVTGAINRKDWGLTWNTNLDSGGVMLGDEVKITCEIELIKAKKGDLEMNLAEAEAEGISS